MRRQLFAAAVVLVALSGAAGAKEQELNGVVIDVPRGWKVERGEAGSLLLQQEFPETDDEERGAALIQLVAPRAVEGTLLQGVATMVGAIPELAEEDTTTEGEGVTSNGYDMVVQYRCCGRVQDIQASLTTVAVGDSGKQAFLQLLTMNLHDEREDEVDAEFAKMVRTMRLKEEDAPFAVASREGDGGLEGAYTFLRTGLMPNVFGGMDFTADSEVVVFDPSGLFSDTIPAGDMSDFCAEHPEDCGTYRVSGGGFWGGQRQIELRRVADAFGRFEVETMPLEIGKDSLTIGEDVHAKVPPFPADTKFDGEWRYFFASSGMSASGSGSIAVERFLRLRPDGTYQRDGFVGASSSMDTGGGTNGVTTSNQRPSTAGRYRVEGYKLILAGDDGSEEVMSIFAPDKGSDELLVIDGSNYLKQD
ncbi:MAG TPA: hypothetical protein VIL88_10360 [Devosia sp.]|jgi:hypothetical protein|uniref:hypothetical protein n=1 Tax=Devosia sp. TaxID=1871048 RepID=UPI002F93BCC3